MIDRSKPDFMMGIDVPANIPSDEVIEVVEPTLEPYLKQLVDSGYMTIEEAVAFVLFVSEFATFVPFIMDSFLRSYRNARKEKAEAEKEAPATSKLIVP